MSSARRQGDLVGAKTFLCGKIARDPRAMDMPTSCYEKSYISHAAHVRPSAARVVHTTTLVFPMLHRNISTSLRNLHAEL